MEIYRSPEVAKASPSRMASVYKGVVGLAIPKHLVLLCAGILIREGESYARMLPTIEDRYRERVEELAETYKALGMDVAGGEPVCITDAGLAGLAFRGIHTSAQRLVPEVREAFFDSYVEHEVDATGFSQDTTDLD